MSRFNTGNNIDSDDLKDLSDNAKNMDLAANSDMDTFQDRLGRSRLTWAGIEKAGSGDPAIAVDAAARAEAAASTAEAAADNVEQNAEQIAQDAAQQAVQDVVAGVDGAVVRAEGAADRAEAASDAAFVNADVYPDVATGRAAVANGEQFQVVEGYDIVRYRRDSASTTEVARYPSAHYVQSAMGGVIARHELISESTNMYDAQSAKVGYAILDDGSVEENPRYSISGYIPVLPGQSYSVTAWSDTAGAPTRAFATCSYYDKDKGFIVRVGINNVAHPGGVAVFEVPAGAYFARFTMNDTIPSRFKRQMNRGSTALPYEEYFPPTLDRIPLGQEHIDQIKTALPDKDSAEQFILKSTNLYDYQAATVGYAILDDGTVSANDSYSHSDFIRVEPNQKYTTKAWSQSSNSRVRGFNAIAYYDADKNFISRSTHNDTVDGGDGVGVFTTLPNAAYIRLNMNDRNPSRDSRQVNKGVADIPFEPYRVQLSGIELASDILHQIGSELQIEKSDSVMFDLPVDGVFNTNEVWSSYGGFRTITANAVYAMFDALHAAHPNYISKQVLGQDDFGYTISCYKFIPKRPFVDVAVKKAKIFITCGTHGFEHMPPLAMYLLLEQMCNNWQSDQLLEVLRHNVDILIIPVVNPSGFDDFTRKNRNGVDINRNFPPNFGWQSTDPESPYYGGVAPLDQKESQYIEQVFNENPDINIMYDFHNFFGTSVETHPHYIWVANAGDPCVQHMAQVLNQRMTRKWKKEFSWLPDDENLFLGRASSVPGAQVQDQARAKGIRFAATFEVCEKWWLGNGVVSMYDATHCKTAVEAIANWLLINLNELKRI